MQRAEDKSTSGQSGVIASERLTKRFFMGLPEGVYVVSGYFDSEFRPLFEQYAAKAGPARERQWEEVKKAQVDKRVCRVFRTQGDSAAFRSRASLGGLQASDVLGTVPSTAQMHTARAPTVLETGGLPR